MKKVFLSFAAEDMQKVKSLLTFLPNSNYEWDFYEGSLNMDFDSEEAILIKQLIGRKIVMCNLTVCLIGENTYKSRWVDCQLQKSRNKGNKIIAMALKGVKDVVLPQMIREENLTFYPWNPKKLIELINGSILKKEGE